MGKLMGAFQGLPFLLAERRAMVNELTQRCGVCKKAICDDEYVVNWGSCNECMDKSFDEYLANRPVKVQEEEAAETAHERLNAGNIAAEEDKFGEFPVIPFKGEPFVFDEKNPKFAEMVKPTDNPEHRFRHGLEGAYDPECNDICCRPARLA
jgi:hypothetical protein